MESLFYKFKKILEQQDQIIIDLIEVASEHNLALRGNDSEAIINSIKKQELLVDELKRLDEIREQLQTNITQDLNLESDLTLKDIIEALEQRGTLFGLDEISEDLIKHFNQLAEIVRLNKLLAKNGLQFIEQLKQIYNPHKINTYQSTGKMETQSISLAMFNKTI